VIPVVYTYVDDLVQWLARLFGAEVARLRPRRRKPLSREAANSYTVSIEVFR